MTVCLLLALASLVLGLVLGQFLAQRSDRRHSERALRAETALEIARQNLDLARGEAQEALAQLGQAREGAAAKAAQLEEARRQLERERTSLGEALVQSQTQLRDTFRALAGEALEGANKQFAAMAQGGLRALTERAAGDLEQRHVAVATLVQPLREALARLTEEQGRLAQSRTADSARLSAELAQLRSQSDQLSSDTQRLVNALRAPQVRGRWGEIQLRRTAELAGMSAHCDFSEQETVQGAEGVRRPDMVVHLPRGREVIVDSKVPFSHFLEAVEAHGDVEREEALRRHAQLVRAHVEKLSEKRYWAQFDSAEFVVLFLPNDSFLAAAAERDPGLLERAIEARVVLATPSTFIALLRAIAVGWKEERLAENAEEIAALGRELFDRLSVLATHWSEIGDGLKKSVRAFNKSVGSLESRVLPQARRFRELGAASEREIEQLVTLEDVPRELN